MAGVASENVAVVHRGREETRRFLEGLLEPWDGVVYSVDEYFEVGENVVMLGTFSARGRGSGVEVAARGAQLYEFSAGRLLAMRQFQTKEEAMAAATKAD